LVLDPGKEQLSSSAPDQLGRLGGNGYFGHDEIEKWEVIEPGQGDVSRHNLM
jgi:hypothetical protein